MRRDLLQRAEDVLFRVLEAPKTLRAQALDRECGSDAELRREVASLLAQADAIDGFLENPALGTDISTLSFPNGESALAEEDLAGERVGPYVLERRLAAGGMGTVYLGRRADGQFDQRVAVKLVRRGLDTDEILRRFRVERQTLAALNHPNIARLVDGGVTREGRPYLVMEYVDGQEIDEYCDARTLNTLDRLKLFRAVCEAVRYAHQHLVVHRDLKPRNILVTPAGEPKLLDFGIAKVLTPGDTARAAMTTRGEERRLTPEYASPEQLKGTRAAAASDVYSLGVILYELLTGRRPYRVGAPTSDAIVRFIESPGVPLPSAAISREDQPVALQGIGATDAHAIASTREGSVARLRRRLRGDLDTIILNAMHADPARRYPSVESLVADIDRYLAGLPILARKDTFWYRAMKFATRNSLQLTAAAAILLVGGAGVVAIAQERNQAYLARDQAEAISTLLQDALASADPANRGRDAKVVDVLRDAQERVDVALAGRPLVQAAVLSTIGRTYLSLGDTSEAERHIRRAYDLRLRELGAGHHDVAESKMDLAEVFFNQGKLTDAETLYREALERHRMLRGERNLDTARCYNDLGSVLRAQRKLDDAEAMQLNALEIRTALSGAESIEVAESLNNLANIYRTRNAKGDANASRPEGRLSDRERAIELTTRSLAIRVQRLRPDHPLVLQSRLNLAALLGEQAVERAGASGHLDPAGERLLASAMDMFDSALPIARDVYGVESTNYARVLRQKANTLILSGEGPQAIPVMREVIEIQERVLPADDPTLHLSRILLVDALAQSARLAETTVHITTLRASDAATRHRSPWRHMAGSLADAHLAAGHASDAAEWRAEAQAPAPK